MPGGGPRPAAGVRVARVVAVAAAVAVAGSFLLPWARSGRAVRSGFALARTVDALGLADAPALRALLLGVWLTPRLVALAWTAAVLGRWRVTGALAALAGALAVAAGALVGTADGISVEPGCWTGMVAGVAAITAGVMAATTARRADG